MAIPVWDTRGEIHCHQYKPDSPRSLGGRKRKYEWPYGVRLAVDVPPPALPEIKNPARPLWITEGPIKADAAVSARLVCVATFGVFGWRGANGQGGKVLLPDWDSFALNGRQVFLADDSDMGTSDGPAHGAARLGAVLDARGADVRYVYLPPGPDGAKVGLDDWFAVHGYDIGGLLTYADDQPPARQKKILAVAPARPAVPAPDDAAALLGELHDWLVSYVAFTSPHHAVAVTLWIAHTHLADRFDSTGRLVLLSPEPECGKTRVLELAEPACAGAEFLNDASPAYMFRRIGAGTVTILLDECDAIWRRGKADESAEAVRSIVNAGHRKGAAVGRVEMTSSGAELKRFEVYAPAALAAKGDPLPDTVMSRAVVIHMRRRPPGTQLRRYRQRVTRREGEELHDKLKAWAASVAGKVGDPWPDLPDGVDDRPADVWEPLVVVADLAGGDWPELSRDACTALISGARDDAQGTGTQLLDDIRATWPKAVPPLSGTSGTSGTCLASHVPHVPHVPHRGTGALLRALHALDESPWGDWDGHPMNPRDLAKLLRLYGIKATKIRISEKQTVRGYRCEDFDDAWRCFLPALKPDDPD